MHRNSLKSGFSTLDGTYLQMRGTEYRMIHDKIYKMAALICGQKLTECFIKYAPSVFIRDNFIFDSVYKSNDDLIVLFKDQEEDYFERLLRDLRQDVITSTFQNKQLIFHLFRDKLISFFGKSDDAKTVLKKLHTEDCIQERNIYKQDHLFEVHLETTPLIESVISGYGDIVRFLLENIKCYANNTNIQGISKASENKHSNVPELLLGEYNVVSRCKTFGESLLDIACRGGHTDIITKYGNSSLSIACKRGYPEIVKMLLQYNADVSQCPKYGESPLYIACEMGYTVCLFQPLRNFYERGMLEQTRDQLETVQLLLAWNADVKMCNKTPLDIARKSQSVELVNLLRKISI
ncbi:unnamed protein product [Mytilus edulis]|uniref:Uncharacterized protein n=1 Tax=Mytilus edulis TaxID=6550 RepID=A0A8S3T226_MYTED|nr:unnamed protein product [Mytilus edulis]